MPKLIIDNKEVEFKTGETVIQAALKAGIDIPHFCWHPTLSVSGNCRICLVEIEKMPKLAISCATLAAEGMVVYTNSDKALQARQAVMEFLLINHPLDCPICDEAGECKLQDYAYDHSVGESRFKELKQQKQKRVPIGPNVMFDGERCISCSRCIRFCDEIVKESQLTFVQRGDRVTIETYPGKELDNAYSLNTTDICPVGALTNRDFRFRARVWEMSSTKSVCNGCARGCNTEMWVRNNLILRLTPRLNEDVNSYWMCDYGRLNTWKFINEEDRVNGSYVKNGQDFVLTNIKDTYALAAQELKKFKKDEIAFIASPYATLEDNYMFLKLAKQLDVKNISYMEHIHPEFEDNLLRRADMTPNATGLKLLGIMPDSFDNIIQKISSKQVKAVYLLEDDLLNDRPELAEVLSKLELFIVNALNFNKTTQFANIVFPAASYAEKFGTIVNFQERVQRLFPSVATLEADRYLDGFSMSRLDKFGTDFDKWANKNRKDAHSSWKMILSIGNHVGIKTKYNMVEDVFLELTENYIKFKDLDYDALGDHGVQLNTKMNLEKVK